MSASKIIVVGAGKWGMNIINTVYELGNLCAIVESNQEVLQQAMKHCEGFQNVSWHLTLQQALVAIPKASVIIATPPHTHFSLAQSALMAARHVFVEKPMCQTTKDSKSLVCFASNQRRVLMVDHLLRYNKPHRDLLDLVQSGFVGEVTRIRMTRLNFGTIRTHENVLWSLSPHDVSVLLAIMNDELPQTITAQGQKLVSKDIEDHVTVNLHFKNNVHAQIEASWYHPEKERRTFVYGTKGVLILNEYKTHDKQNELEGFQWSAERNEDGSAVMIEKSQSDLTQYLNNEKIVQNGYKSTNDPPLKSAITHFIDCVSKGFEPITDSNEGHRVVTVLEAATASLAQNGSLVSVPFHSTPGTMIHETAIVAPTTRIGKGTKVWHFSHVMDGAIIGDRCNIGQNVYIGGKAILRSNIKVQNNVSIYDAVEIDDDVFLGPSCVLTNVKTPRSHVSRKHMYESTKIEKGATIGANATIVCGVKLGEYCFVGAGAVVTKDVKPHALVYGNPATQHGWVSTSGIRLELGSDEKLLKCPETGEIYTLHKDETSNKLGSRIERLTL